VIGAPHIAQDWRAAFAAQGQLTEGGRPFNPRTIRAIVEGPMPASSRLLTMLGVYSMHAEGRKAA
jgi:hypothetical protein